VGILVTYSNYNKTNTRGNDGKAEHLSDTHTHTLNHMISAMTSNRTHPTLSG